jgi:hypothetical protein
MKCGSKGFAMSKRRISMMLIFCLLILTSMACESTTPLVSVQPFGTPSPFWTPAPFWTPSPYSQVALQAEYAAAQSTLDYGQSQMKELSHQATVASLNMAQAANAAKQATLDYNQRQIMELAYQINAISQNMAQAAATQQFITLQTQSAWNATATAQSQAATATYSAYILNFTQTAQAQAILNVHAAGTGQAAAALTAFPRTATPLAETQAAILFQQRKYERQSFWGEIVTPIKVVLTTLVILLLIVGGILAFQRFMPVLESRLRNPRRNRDISPLFLMDGKIVDLDPHHPRLPSNQAVQVEIIGPSEPSVTNWITEAEQKLRSDGRMPA